MPDIEKTLKGLEALEGSMREHQCYTCSHEFIETAQQFGTDIVANAIELIKKQKTGHWIDLWDKMDPDISEEGRCSVCKRISARPLGQFCKWCGAEMSEV